MIFAIDPGNIESAYCIMTKEYNFKKFIKDKNKKIMEDLLSFLEEPEAEAVVIERIASFGMPVGREVFDTCEWIGRFAQEAEKKLPVHYIYRKEEKIYICGSPRAKDANIRQALIERFAKHDTKNGRGTKANPDVFYGVRADIWAACAVGVTFLDKETELNLFGGKKNISL